MQVSEARKTKSLALPRDGGNDDSALELDSDLLRFIFILLISSKLLTKDSDSS